MQNSFLKGVVNFTGKWFDKDTKNKKDKNLTPPLETKRKKV